MAAIHPIKQVLTLPFIWFYWLTAACDDLTNSISCDDVCDRYQGCYDENYDVDRCVDRCEDAADADEDNEERLEACDECMDDESCVSAVFECSTQCVGIIP